MALVQQISTIVNIFLAVVIIFTGLIGGIGYYFLKVRRVTSKQEIINYNSFERRSSLEYVKFDNIISGVGFDRSDKEGLIVTDNDTTFTAGISITGYNFYNASAEEQRSTMVNYMSFLHAVESPIQLRQTTKAIDVTYTIDKYEKRKKEIMKEIAPMEIQFQELRGLALDYEDSPDELEVLLNDLTKLKNEIETKQRFIEELDEQIGWLNTISTGKYDTETVSTLLISWHFNPNDYIQDLSKEEVYLKAFVELETKTDILASALQRCQCKCERLSADDLVDLIRRHNHPETGDEIALTDLVGTALDSLYISSDSLLEAQKSIMDDELYYAMMNEIAMDRQDELERAEAEMNLTQSNVYAQLQQEVVDYNPMLEMNSNTGEN